MEELWRRVTQDFDFANKLADFRKTHGIPPNGYDQFFDVLNGKDKDGLSIIIAMEDFIFQTLLEYGLGEYIDELSPPLLLYVALNEIEQLTNHSHLVEFFGIRIVDGTDIIKAVETVNANEHEVDKKLKELHERTITREQLIVKALKSSTVLIIKPHASLEDLKNLHRNHPVWQEIMDMRERKSQNPFGEMIRTRSQANLHKLIYQAREDGVIKSDGYIADKYKDGVPDKYKDISLLTTHNIEKILDRERHRRKRKTKGE